MRSLQPLCGDKLGERSRVVRHRHPLNPATHAAHLVGRTLGSGPPTVIGEPVGNGRPILVVVDQFLHVDGLLDTEHIGHFLEPCPHFCSPLFAVHRRSLGRDPAARHAHGADLGEQPVLGLGR